MTLLIIHGIKMGYAWWWYVLVVVLNVAIEIIIRIKS